MNHKLDLSSAWSKLERARVHIKILRSEIGVKADEQTASLTVSRAFEPQSSAIIWRIQTVIQVRDHWSLIVGDAAHNLRCALDHLAWQLAIKHFKGVEPTNPVVIRQIQFPVVVERNRWPDHMNRKYMDAADAQKLEDFQPFNLGPISRSKGQLHALETLAGFGGLDNIDKHREIHITEVAPFQTTIGGSGMFFTDCTYLPGPQGTPQLIAGPPGDPPEPGNEILRLPVIKTGPNPDVNFNATQTAYVAIRGTWNVLEALDAMDQGVDAILKRFL
jgi:hypothetical protein